jgi:4-alpha-glucanotransferase
VLLHVTSLPGPFGIGDLGPEAERFLERLHSAGQSVWQVLPLGPTGLGDSPYHGLSSFAGNPLLVSPERLAEDGLLEKSELAAVGTSGDPGHADFEAARALRAPLLRRAFERLEGGRAPALRDELEAWSTAPEQRPWLDDWTLFASIRSRMERRAWTTWPEGVRRREPAAIAEARRELATDLRFHRFVQFAFARQWAGLREAARARQVALFGDLPIYPAEDAADVWARPDLFTLDAEGRPAKIAGVPPDYFSEDGQLWGNPLLRWEALAAEGYAWWIDRLRAHLARFDLVRLDHFRGYEAFWELPAGAANARGGAWVPGPRARLFDAVRAALGTLPLVAEDLGVITDEVRELRRATGLPGMRVLQFAFGEASSDHRPHALDRATVLYTGTHDNDTSAGWFAAAGRDERRRALEYLGCAARRSAVPWAMVRAAWTSVAELAIAPMQDLLALGPEARMNRPGVSEGNWRWRLEPGRFDERLGARLRRLTAVADRLPAAPAAAPPPA